MDLEAAGGRLVVMLLLALLQAVTRLEAEECTDVGTDSIVWATCHVDGRVEVIWEAFSGIQLFYNCTGSVQQADRLYGWGWSSVGRQVFYVNGWNYYNSTCYIYGCYDDANWNRKAIPSVACTVLEPPHMPTSAFSPSVLVDPTISMEDAPHPSLVTHPHANHPPPSSVVLPPLRHMHDPDFATTAGPASQQTFLLITAAIVGTVVVVILTLVLVVIGRMSINRRRKQYNVRRIAFRYEEHEVKIDNKVDIENNVTCANSTESIFDKFVSKDQVNLKSNAPTDFSKSDLTEQDAVSDCQTVPLEEETIVEEEEVKEAISTSPFTEENSSLTSSSLSSGGRGKKEIDFDEDMCAKDSFAFCHPHPTFHPMKVRGCSSTSTCGQTSDYVCTSYSSGANTVSTNNMDYVLFPEDFSSAPDDVESGEDDAFESDKPPKFDMDDLGKGFWQPTLGSEIRDFEEQSPGMADIKRQQPKLAGSLQDMPSQIKSSMIDEVKLGKIDGHNDGNCGCGLDMNKEDLEGIRATTDSRESCIHGERTGSSGSSKERTTPE